MQAEDRTARFRTRQGMGRNFQGVVAAVALSTAVFVSLFSLQGDWRGATVFALAIILLEQFGQNFGTSLRYSPAAPLYLAAACTESSGTLLAALLITAVTAIRTPRNLLENLGGYRAVAIALAAVSITRELQPNAPALSVVVACLFYAAVTQFGSTEAQLPNDLQEKQAWYLYHLRIRPLELGQVCSVPFLLWAYENSPWTVLLSIPLLATGKLAAESILHKSREAAAHHVAQELAGAHRREQQVEQRLHRAQDDKKALAAFSRLLLQKPDLQSAAQGLLKTAGELVDFDSAAVFLGQPPEPFIYRAEEAVQMRLQSSTLTGLREPVVDRAWRERRPVHQRRAPEEERLFLRDQVAAAVPLAGLGILYFGRTSSEPFSKENLDQLSWLADKAKLALSAAYEEEEELRRKRALSQTVESLEHRVAWMALLVKGSEALVATLDRDLLRKTLVDFVQQAVPHTGGYARFSDGRELSWGRAVTPHPGLEESIATCKGALRLNDLSLTPYQACCDDAVSLLGCALREGERVRGLLILCSEAKSAFSREMADLLILLGTQAAMAFSNAELYQDVVEARRHLEESQAQLVQSSKLTALGQLAAGIAHELNTPLGAISLAIEETMRQVESGKVGSARLLETAQKAVGQSRGIIDRLMAYARTPSGEPATFLLSDTLKDVSEFLAIELESEKTKFALETEEGLAVRGQYQALVQVFLNLMSNAVHAVKERALEERRITVSARATGDWAVTKIQDNGCGIPPEIVGRIFDPFFTTKPVGRGTGLGLWAAHRIVTEHGGRLEVNSEVGHGTCFSVFLPRAAKAGAHNAPA